VSRVPRGNLNLANLFSLLRVPLALLFLLYRDAGVRLFLIALAGISDFLDGWVARRRGGTRLGALLDPITDKVFLVTALISLAVNGPLRLVELLVLLARDIAVAFGLAVVLLRRAPVRMAARMPGKVVTVLQLLALVVLTAFPAWRVPVVLVVGMASAIAIADYGNLAMRGLRAREPAR
jgi:CDP-diacylglycerol--glycerol-3-phosphate 3-phosphatidyltransferase/cardiolipin synthase